MCFSLIPLPLALCLFRLLINTVPKRLAPKCPQAYGRTQMSITNVGESGFGQTERYLTFVCRNFGAGRFDRVPVEAGWMKKS